MAISPVQLGLSPMIIAQGFDVFSPVCKSTSMASTTREMLKPSGCVILGLCNSFG